MRNAIICLQPPDDGRTQSSRVIGLCTNLLFYIYKKNENLLAGCLADGASSSLNSNVTFIIFLYFLNIFMAFTKLSITRPHERKLMFLGCQQQLVGGIDQCTSVVDKSGTGIIFEPPVGVYKELFFGCHLLRPHRDA